MSLTISLNGPQLGPRSLFTAYRQQFAAGHYRRCIFFTFCRSQPACIIDWSMGRSIVRSIRRSIERSTTRYIGRLIEHRIRFENFAVSGLDKLDLLLWGRSGAGGAARPPARREERGSHWERTRGPRGRILTDKRASTNPHWHRSVGRLGVQHADKVKECVCMW